MASTALVYCPTFSHCLIYDEMGFALSVLRSFAPEYLVKDGQFQGHLEMVHPMEDRNEFLRNFVKGEFSLSNRWTCWPVPADGKCGYGAIENYITWYCEGK